ncbi:matrixin family metalloprotease [Halomicrococcus sp. NG-SE-24]|uniref:matrixin family metalloprotease n=1 Tax=Halomicrococcus sp. NG-SE-24 TaxID=3436928 RepID=UPI003D97D8E1
MKWRALVLVALVVLAGCSQVQIDAETTPSTTPDTTTHDATTTAADEESRQSSAARTVADRENPWGESTLTVAVENTGAPSRDFTQELQRALGYWENHSEQYAGYPIDYELAPNAENPDLVVRFVEQVESCPRIENAAGCAPYVTEPGHVDRPMHVEVDASFSSNSTVLVLKHELGHTLGLNHSAAPQSIMNHSAALATRQRVDADERALPWADAGFTVYLAPTPDRDRSVVRRQVTNALEYYGRGADGTVPSNLTFEFTRGRSTADVVVRFPDDLPCQSTASCGRVSGVDPDRDGKMEEYERLVISIGDVDTEAVGWHVGYWFGYGMGLDDSELPPPLRDDDQRKSDWWT